MTAFTVDDTAAIRRRIQADLDTVTATVRRGDPHLRALVLTGGFARGEGTVLDGEPQNDYDFIAVRGWGPSRPYPEMAQELADRLGLPIDLAPVWSPRLRVAGRSIFWYETANRGRVLWGDETVLDRIRIRRPDEIAKGEAMRLLANRAAGLLLATDHTPHAKRIQASKALLGALDAHLLARGVFPPTHRERWEAYQALRADGDGPAELAECDEDLAWAYRFKTRPSGTPERDATDVWQRSADAVLAALPAALHIAGLDSLDDYARHDTWVERLHYWARARSLGTRPWMFHPSSRVRVATLELLRQRRGGQAGREDSALHRLVRDGGEDVAALQILRRATLQ